eukprot:12891196-Prorocentrum_lima.AAC.1
MRRHILKATSLGHGLFRSLHHHLIVVRMVHSRGINNNQDVTTVHHSRMEAVRWVAGLQWINIQGGHGICGRLDNERKGNMFLNVHDP